MSQFGTELCVLHVAVRDEQGEHAAAGVEEACPLTGGLPPGHASSRSFVFVTGGLSPRRANWDAEALGL